MKQKSTVLIVDDEPRVLDMISKGLSIDGYECKVALDGEKALQLINKSSFDFLIADVVLPGIDGFVLTQKVKRLRPDMLVIIMTGFVKDFSYDIAVKAGASDFIGKPFSVQELLIRMKQVKMQEQLRIMSITDDLTGLLNRRGFYPMAEHQLKIALRYSDTIALLYADQDNLKDINDTWGHKEGDNALKETARILRDTFRDADIIARMGGDEFAILMMVDPELDDRVILDRLQENFNSFNEKRNNLYTLSVSTGFVYSDPGNPSSLEFLLSQADALMYENKQMKKYY
jgi:diguanylate cyclase (GGDEF)-like protein